MCLIALDDDRNVVQFLLKAFVACDVAGESGGGGNPGPPGLPGPPGIAVYSPEDAEFLAGSGEE